MSHHQQFMMIRRIMKTSSFFLYLLTTTSLFCSSSGGDTLTTGQPLADDDEATLISAGGSFELGFFSPVDDVGSNNSRYIGIWYHKISVQTVVWVANRQRPVIGRSGLLSVKADGTLVITQDNSSTVIWSSGSSAAPANSIARLLDNGNFVVGVGEAGSSASVDPNSYAWQSFDFPTDTYIPGMLLGWNLTSGLNRNLTSWTTATDPARGNYALGIDLHGDPPQEIIWSAGTRQYWRGGPWNGLRFSGVPEMNAYSVVYSELVMDSEQVVVLCHLNDASVIVRTVMNHTGTLQSYVWIAERNLWNLVWFAPKDVCDSVSRCGPYGVCQSNISPSCRCLQGFHWRNPMISDLGDTSAGCTRNSALDCRNGSSTDGFEKQSNVKLPDTSRATTVVDMMSLDECRGLCLRNCSCTAYASANISSGSGCILWTSELTDMVVYAITGSGQDLYFRLAAADVADSESKHHNHVVGKVVVPTVVLIFLLTCAAAAFYVWRRKKTSCFFEEEKEEKDFDLPLYDLSTIIDATGNFSINNKLGQGGFGPVYKGKLREGEEIAVKRLSKTSTQGPKEFKNEVELIAKLQHRNLVRLLGCCIRRGERMLIYEYMPNRSLDVFLFDKAKGALLDWATRYNIIIGIARGLLYLHHDSRCRIIHRDLKASNILLDKDLNPKISDFGLARIFGGDEKEANTQRIVGTYGYMSPEYAMDGIFSIKSDVFSFGMLVLEIISGIKNRRGYHSTSNLNLLGHIWELWKEDKCLEFVDTSIGHSLPIAEVVTCIKVGLLCVQERPEDRPKVSSIVVMLGSDSAQLPQPKRPGFVTTRDPSIDIAQSSSSKQQLPSLNQVSVTMLEGR